MLQVEVNKGPDRILKFVLFALEQPDKRGAILKKR